MIIKIIPETDAEKERMKEVEHSGISEFFMFGSKKDEDGDLLDFHDWTGSYRYLMGGLYYFTKLVEADQFAKNQSNNEQTINIKAAPTPTTQIEMPNSPFVKQGAPLADSAPQIIDVDFKGKDKTTGEE